MSPEALSITPKSEQMGDLVKKPANYHNSAKHSDSQGNCATFLQTGPSSFPCWLLGRIQQGKKEKKKKNSFNWKSWPHSTPKKTYLIDACGKEIQVGASVNSAFSWDLEVMGVSFFFFFSCKPLHSASLNEGIK